MQSPGSRLRSTETESPVRKPSEAWIPALQSSSLGESNSTGVCVYALGPSVGPTL